MPVRTLLGLFSVGICLAQSTPPLRLGPVHNLLKPGSVDVLIELPNKTSANAQEFQLIEDGHRTSRGASLSRFRDSNWKLAVVLALDVSRSLSRQEFDEVKAAVVQFVSELKDPVALISFGDSAEILATFSTPRETLLTAISQLHPVGRHTRLYDAVNKSLQQLENRSQPERQRVIVISDGAEESQAGPDSIDSVIAKAEQRRVAIDTVWLPTSTAGARNTLVRLSERTDGYHVDAKRSAPILAGLRQVVQRTDNSVVVAFDRVLGSGMTKEVGVALNQAGVASASISLQIPLSTRARSANDRFQWFLGLSGTVQVLTILTGAAIVLLILYVISFMVVKKYFAGAVNKFPWDPTRLFKPALSPAPAMPIPVQPARSNNVIPPVKPSGRKTVVEHLQNASAGSGLTLDAVSGPLRGRRIPIESKRFRIGADEDSDLPIPQDDYVSGHHALIQAGEGGWLLADQDSRNGTFVDGKRLEAGLSRLLRSGQTVQIGTSEFVVILGSDSSSAPASSTSGTIR